MLIRGPHSCGERALSPPKYWQSLTFCFPPPFAWRSYIGSFLNAAHAARAFDRVAIALRGWRTATNFPAAEYRADALMPRFVDMDEVAVPRGSMRTLLLPGVTMADFVDEIRAIRESHDGTAALHPPAVRAAPESAAAALAAVAGSEAAPGPAARGPSGGPAASHVGP